MNERITYGDQKDALQQRIDQLPPDLESLYQVTWERFGAKNPREYRQTAALYFKFMLRGNVAPFSWSAGPKITTILFILATTPIADQFKDALDDPSRLVTQDVLLQHCEEVKRKVMICCVGLVEVHRPDERIPPMSWYGHKYDSISTHGHIDDLVFIHRTARDFLTDTESGRKILGRDASSDLNVHYRLVQAALVELVLSPREYFVIHWPDALRDLRIAGVGRNEWVSMAED